MGLYQTKKLLQSKRNFQQNKRQPTKWEKILANNSSDKGLISKIIKNSYNSTPSKQTNQLKKWAEDLNRYFSQENIQMAYRYMKRHLTPLSIREMQIKNTMRFHLTPLRMAVIYKKCNSKWRGCREKGTLVHCWWECKLVQPLWKTVWGSPQN